MITLGRTVEEYLNSLPEDRQMAMDAVRNTILDSLPPGYEEHLRRTAIYYEVPQALVPKGQGKRPLVYAGLASQKNTMSVYLRAVYFDQDLNDEFTARWLAGGRKLDMGKNAIRFRSLEEVDPGVLADAISAYTVADYVRLVVERRSR
jgi:hypothetical protein